MRKIEKKNVIVREIYNIFIKYIVDRGILYYLVTILFILFKFYFYLFS